MPFPAAPSRIWTMARDPFHPAKDIAEPQFHHGRGGGRRPRSPATTSSPPATRSTAAGRRRWRVASKASNEGEGEDDFVFNLSREEFPRRLLRRPGLPNLVKTQLARIHEYKSQRAGFTNDGVPANINVVRSCAAPRPPAGPRVALPAAAARAAGRTRRAENPTHPEDDPEVVSAEGTRSPFCVPRSSAIPSSTPSTCATTTASAGPNRPPRR